MAIEEPKFIVVKSFDDGFEIRQYQGYITAEVTVEGSFDEAGNKAFKKLAGYIFGKNAREESIAMTAPVTTMPVSKDSYTLVKGDKKQNWVVQFTMPAEYQLKTLPAANDKTIRFSEQKHYRVAVKKFSGSWSLDNIKENSTELKAWVTKKGLKTEGNEVLARYNSPFALWFMRRNELWLKIATPVSEKSL